MKILKILSRIEIEKLPYAIVESKGNCSYITKRNGQYRSRLDSKTFEVLWTADWSYLNPSNLIFLENSIHDVDGKILDLSNNETYSLKDKIENYYWNDIKDNNHLLFGTLDNQENTEIGVFKIDTREILWKSNLKINGIGVISNDFKSFFKAYLTSKKTIDGIISLNYLTGETLWQRSFEELAITRLDKFVGDVGEILVCVCDENLLLGIDKATGEVSWRVRQKVKISNILLNKVSGNLYQFYNTWECDNTDDLAEGFQLIFLEINTQTGEILYDDDIFKHPKHQVIGGLGTNEDILNWRFHKALQWGSKIYFLLSQIKMGTKIVKVVAFDVILHRFTEVLETLFYITANECWFMAEGKIFLTSKLMDKVFIEHPDDYIKGFGDGDLKKFELYFNQKLDSEKYGRVDSFRQNGNEEYYAFTKEEYLTIIDLEDN